MAVTRKELIEALGRDIGLFAKVALPDIVQKPYSSLHLQIFDVLMRRPERALIIAPRGTAKTTIASTVGTLFDIAYDREDLVVLMKKTQAHATRDLRAITTLVKHCAEFKTIYGTFTFEKDTDQEVVIRHDETGHRMCILSFGSEQDVRGTAWENKRPTKFLMDDWETRQNTESPESRARNERILTQDVEPALSAEKGTLIMIGTVPHYDSQIWRIKEAAESGGHWEVIYRQIIEDGKSLWPEMFPLSRIERIRRSYSDRGLLHVFYQEYMNIPITEEQRMLKGLGEFNEPIEFIDGMWWIGGEEKRPAYCFIGVDPSLGTPDGAETGIVVLFVDSAKNRYVVDAICGHFKPYTTVEKLFELDRNWHPQAIGIEEVGMQQILIEWLDQAQVDKNYFLPIARGKRELKPVGAKEERIFGRLQSLIEAGKVFARPHLTSFWNQVSTFPKGRRSDLLDAFVYADAISYYPPANVAKRKKHERRRRIFDWKTR